MSSSSALFQNSIYVGINLEDILYGVELVLYFKTMHVLLFSKRGRTKADVFFAIFSTVMLMMLTLWVATQASFGEKMWLIDADFPGGPDAYWGANSTDWYMDLGAAAVLVMQLMTDALMIYRTRLIWESRRVIILPAILWLVTLALGSLVVWATSIPPGTNFFTNMAAQLSLAYYSISVGQTAILTVLICYRMVTHGLAVKGYLGDDYAAVYFALVTLIIESVVPYTLSGIAFVVSVGAGSNTSIAFSGVYNSMMCISPQMVILRVASGLGWNETTGRVLPSTVRFSHPGAATGTWTEPRCVEDGVGAVKLEAIPENGDKGKI